MRSQFIFSAIVFHACLAVAAFAFLARARGRLARGVPAAGVRLVVDGAILAAVMLVLAAVASPLAPPAGFTLMRLWAQALFGWGPLLALVLAALHSRASHRAPALALLAVVALLLAVYVEAYHREPQDLRVRQHEVDLHFGPAPGRTLRIVHLSDLQTHRIGEYERRALEEALRQKPDLIVMTGDYIQTRLDDTRDRAEADLRALFKKIGFAARLGVYAVQGDVDRHWPSLFAGTSVRCLSGETATIDLGDGRHLSLVGLTVGMSKGRDPEATLRLVEGTPADSVRIVLGHRPDFVMKLAGRARVDLALAGHTHGGQVVLPFLGPPITKSRLPRRYAAGLHDYRGLKLHVSPGIGMERDTAPQIRFLCPPEVSVLDLRY